ncbi:MAG TPA: hypothetical protein VFQ41_00495 [Candidatus Angelobacter sp.]|nr:hypothetical protein [Candidatus Angelobacter sp.]
MFEKLLAKRHIQNLDLSSVRANAMTKLGWSSEKAQRVENSYKHFLYALAHKEENDLLSPPSQEVDDFWHQHILDTRKYREDCNTVFGHYIDHTPRLSPEDQRRADARREQVYRDYDIDAISLATPNPRRSRDDDGGFDGDFDGCGGSSSHSSGHHAHGHDSGAHSGHAGADHGDGGGHADSGGDSGGADAGGGDGGSGCGGSGCGGGCGGG